ncbi:hypothetical protein [Enterococcus rotai]|uniref:hypothetical protein n=1 Tax=Enterococcus rotai TaxID=118060 RepID=UPI0035C70A4C
MKEMTVENQKDTLGGFYWKCQAKYHSGWRANTFVSAWHGTWASANSRRAEHVKTYSHASDSNTWVSKYN